MLRNLMESLGIEPRVESFRGKDVVVARKSTFSYMVNLFVISCIGGLGLLRIWRILLRTSLVLDNKNLIVNVGRYFVKDTDVIPVRSIDNIKIDNTIAGYFFGYSNIHIYTRADKFKYNFFDKEQSKQLVRRFLEVVDNV